MLTFQASHLALFRRGRLQPGETLVVHAAASGLGTAGVQLGKAVGARVIAVAGGPEKGALCASLGADLVIDNTGDLDQLRGQVEKVWAALVERRDRGDLPGGDGAAPISG